MTVRAAPIAIAIQAHTMSISAIVTMEAVLCSLRRMLPASRTAAARAFRTIISMRIAGAFLRAEIALGAPARGKAPSLFLIIRE